VDREQLGRFVDALFRYADDDTVVSLRAFRDDADGTWAPSEWPSVRVNGIGLEPIVAAAGDFAERCAGAPVPVVFAPPITTFRTEGSAAERDVANGLVLSVECDRDAPRARAYLEGLIGTATLVVASGGQWVDPETGEITPKLHLHWRLKEPTRSLADHHKLKQARQLAQRLVGSDASAVPLVHPIRWAGSWHRKAEPRLTKIVGGNPEAEIELDDALERLCEVAAVVREEKPDDRQRASSEPQADAFDVIAALQAIPNGDVPWDEWNKVGLATWRATGGSEAGFAGFAAWSAKSGKNDPSVTRSRWDHFATSPPNEIGAGTLFYMASHARPGWCKPSSSTGGSGATPRGPRQDSGGEPGGADAWPEPEALIEPQGAERPYPLDAMPDIIAAAVREYRAYGQQPLSLIASSALAAAALASQGLADVARDLYLTGPISLNFATVAVSGERKTSTDRHFTKEIRDWQSEKRQSLANEDSEARAAISAWEAERDGLLAKIKASSGRKGTKDEADIKALKSALAELQKNKPAGIVVPLLFYEDVNAETLAVTFAEGWPSASLWSDEGGLVIGSNGMSDENLMKFVALLNRLWDGSSFERLRLTTRSAEIRGRRFTVSLMMQPIVMARMLGACGGATRNMGFIARNLVAWPTSTIGRRLYTEPPGDMPKIQQFNSRLRELLDKKLPTQGPRHALELPALTLSDAAKAEWTSFFDSIEAELSRGGEFGDVPDIGSKIAENAARLAGVFHVIQHGAAGDIKEDLMRGAISIVSWHLNEARRVINANRRPGDVVDAELLLEWLLRQEAKPVDPRSILQFGPAGLRDRKRRDAATKVLADKHWLFESGNPARLILNPKARTAP
jgi:hypothetical protein